MRLSKYFYPFYKNYRSILALSTVGLSVPLILRGVIDIYIWYDEELAKVIDQDLNPMFALGFYIITEIIPIIF